MKERPVKMVDEQKGWQKDLQAKSGLDSLMSREFAFLINNWVLLFAAFMVTFATLFPSLYKFAMGAEINVGPAFFNVWMVPVGLILLFLTGVGPLLSWRKSTPQTLFDQFKVPATSGLMFLGAGAALSIYHYGDAIFFVRPETWTLVIAGIPLLWLPSAAGYAVATVGICGFVIATIVQEYTRAVRARQRNTGQNAADAFVTLITKAKRRYGGYVVHFGVVLMFFGFAGEAYKTEIQETIKKGQSVPLNNYNVRLDTLTFEDDGQKNMVTAHVTLLEGETEIAKMAPAKWAYRKPEDQVTTEVDKHLTLAGDVYLVLGAYDADAGTVVLQMKFNPHVNFVWLGCGFLMFGFCIAAWPDAQKSHARGAAKARRFAVGFATMAAALVATVLAFV